MITMTLVTMQTIIFIKLLVLPITVPKRPIQDVITAVVKCISRVRFAIGGTPQRHHTSLRFTIEARWTHMRWGRREVSPLTPKNVESLSRTLGKHCEHAWAYIKGFKNSIKQPPNKSIICKKGLKMYQIRTN